MDIVKLRYGNTNTFFFRGSAGGLLLDTDTAGTLPLFFRAIKSAGIALHEIRYVLPTHCHPDHMGLVSALQPLGVTLLMTPTQKAYLPFAEGILSRDRHIPYKPVDTGAAKLLRIEESREFFASLGIRGELISTPSHSPDSISLLLDSGECFVGDLEPFEYLGGYEDNPALREDWEKILSRRPKRIIYAHVNEKVFE